MREAPEPTAAERLEDLATEGLEILDRDGDAALAAFLDQHPAEAAPLAGMIEQARALGLLDRPVRLPQTGDRLGDFRLLDRLGDGGMGVVFAAEQISLRRTVAVKVIRGDLLFFDSARARFQREVEAVASLHHPGIVRVIAVGDAEGVPFYAMERIDGFGTDSLLAGLAGRNPAELRAGDWSIGEAQPGGGCARENPPDGCWWAACARLAHQVAGAMAHAHGRGIVHRDLKPSNVMITADQRAIVIDFGLAHVDLATRLTAAGGEPGSPAYMSPEQLRGEPTDERTDIYSLGASLYEWICLQAPFQGTSIGAVREAVQRGDPIPPRRHYRSLPREVEIVCQRAMDRDRDRRYPTMLSFAADLEALVNGGPIAARPIGRMLRTWRWAQRNRAVASALAATLGSAMLLPLLLWAQEVRANVRVQAQHERAQRNLDTSLAAVDRLLGSLGEAELGYVPGAELQRLRILEDAVELHRRLALDQPDSLALRRARAGALTSCASALTRLGRHPQAGPLLREAIELLGSDELTVEIDWLRRRAYARCVLIVSQSSIDALPDRDHQLARLAFEQERLQATDGSTYAGREMLAQIRSSQATVAGANERESMLRETEGLYSALIADAASWSEVLPHQVAGLELELVRARSALGSLLSQQRRCEEALATIGQGIETLRRQPQPSSANARHLLANLLDLAGLARRDLGREQPDAPLREAVQMLEQLHRDFPFSTGLASALDRSLHNLACTIRAEQPREARLAMERAIAIAAGVLAQRPDLLSGQDRMQQHLGALLPWLVEEADFDGALRAAVRLGELPGTGWRPYAAAFHLGAALRAQLAYRTAPGGNRLTNWIVNGRDLVSTWRVRMTMRPWLDRALAFLHEAERRGWPSGTDLDDPAFDLLRPRAEFAAVRARHP